ncbi:hypothetical protein CRM22_008338 [Opisthorchis felineus]|uniref:Uncharacterized protein n=1 Tax=Opisthorchis felineus TaxID=147828 RepID=A0A4S2LJI9_OPIFE|nr:hypothetical protein CRM22_008338 [Opisthorchis felineus]
MLSSDGILVEFSFVSGYVGKNHFPVNKIQGQNSGSSTPSCNGFSPRRCKVLDWYNHPRDASKQLGLVDVESHADSETDQRSTQQLRNSHWSKWLRLP